MYTIEYANSEERMRNGIKRILKSKKTGTQVRLDSFFTVTSTTPKRKVRSTKSLHSKTYKHIF